MIMNRFTFALAAAIALGAPALAAAPAGAPTAAEAPFVAKITADLNARFATPADAEKAGYVRYTDEDETGAISYANREWDSVDAAHPSQLWYDAKGRLIGADYSVTKAKSPEAPAAMFGLAKARWQDFPAHVHYVLAGANGTATYGATSTKKIVAAGGSADAPTAKALVDAGIAKKASDVKTVFLFPSLWDVGIWLVPNPKGVFSDDNPNVKPTKKPHAMSM